MRFIKFLFISAVAFFIVTACSLRKTNEKTQVESLVQRVLPCRYASFKVKLTGARPDGKDYFRLYSSAGKIVLEGNDGISVASALNFYLKNYCHCLITWNGTNMNLPAELPSVKDTVERVSPYKYRYYLNYCTFNYTMSWWNWDRWQKEIDFMALNGINMPLALTGQNAVWRNVYKKLGFGNDDLKGFFSGPAYLNWFWMGNLDGWGGPLPESYMDNHEALQKKILERERGLGMTPVLPSFTGHVPPVFKKKFPDVKVNSTAWGGFPPVYILSPDEKMFTKIGRMFLQEEKKLYGTDHFYSADTFNENTPPSSDSSYLNDISGKVYECMKQADPSAVWVMQGWLFYNNRQFWKEKEIKALLGAVPDDRMIILDLWAEHYPVWKTTDAFYGKQWLWCMLHNFGGNISLSGKFDKIASGPAGALADTLSGKMEGLGLTMEGIEQNPVVYTMMLENVWRSKPVDIDDFLHNYVWERYGKPDSSAYGAWKILARAVYDNNKTSSSPESIVTARPTFKSNPGWTNDTYLPYDGKDLVKAWDFMISASADLEKSDGYKYDLVDITRQVLANYALDIHAAFVRAYDKRDLKGFKNESGRFCILIEDMDGLLATRKDFLLGKWINDARRMGTTAAEKDLYEHNARDLVTLWGDKDSGLHEYACKQWSGLMDGFYLKRWRMFFSDVEKSMETGVPFDLDAFTKKVKDWEWNWTEMHDVYTSDPWGDEIKVCRALYQKYRSEFDFKIYDNTKK